jgi:hypothetical protein
MQIRASIDSATQIKKPGYAILDIRDGGHEIDLPALLAFFNKHLKP